MAANYKTGTMVHCAGGCGKVTRLVSHEPGPKTWTCSDACAKLAADPAALAQARADRAEAKAKLVARASLAGAGKKSGKKH